MQLKLGFKVLFALVFVTLATASPVEDIARDVVTSPRHVSDSDNNNIRLRNIHQDGGNHKAGHKDSKHEHHHKEGNSARQVTDDFHEKDGGNHHKDSKHGHHHKEGNKARQVTDDFHEKDGGNHHKNSKHGEGNNDGRHGRG